MVQQVEAAVISYTIPNGDFINSYRRYSRFTLGHMSDVHAGSLHAMDNLHEFIDFFHRPQIHSRIDALLCTGDISNGYVGRNKMLTLNEIQSVVRPLLNQNIPTLMVVGNHDSNINEASDYSPIENSFVQALTKEEQHHHMIRDAKQKWGYISEGSTCYYYMDFPSYKIRVIVLDFIDYPVVGCETIPSKLKYNVGFIFSQKQLEWLHATLKNTPKDYGLIIAMHAVPDGRHVIGRWEQGINFLPNVIHAYKTGTRYIHSWNGRRYPELATNVDFDFSENGEREFICWIGGHAHRRFFSSVHNQVMITTSALFTSLASESLYRGRYYPPTLRASGTITQNSFNIIQIDRDLRQIIVTIFGAYRDFDGRITQRTTIIPY
jgi:hypothetical protein